jgi:stress response protein YsnF
MVRAEEQLRVGTERVAATRVRLVKYVVTEEVQVTVPIRREEIRVEEVPMDAVDDGGESLVPEHDSYGAHSAPEPGPESTGGTAGGLPDEIVLHSERPVVTVEVVPRERVRLRTELVQGQETVSGQVQREQIVVDESPTAGRAGPG